MSNVQFQDQNNLYRAPKKKGLEQMIVKVGLAKDAKGAQVVLLFVLAGAVVVALAAPMMLGGSAASTVPQYEIDAALETPRR